jgi:hypothetical protein
MKILDTIHTLDNYREALSDDPTEKLFKRIRKWRDAELVKSDWTQIADAPVDKAAWATYRQALRDLPASNSNPRLIELPVKPENGTIS